MTIASLRELLHQQVDELPDDLVREIADFIAFVLARRRTPSLYEDWTEVKWHQFALSQFLRETDDDIEYTRDDAVEVYNRSM